MIYEARVLALDENVEEEVVLLLGGVELTCFASVCPFPLKEGQVCSVQLNLVVNEYDIRQVAEDAPSSITRVDRGFAYVLTGKLEGDSLKVGDLVFTDEVLLRDYSHFDEHMVVMKVDRIDAEFVE